MTQEEKAKRYDEALEELRGLLEGIREEKCKILEEDITSIFPELQENEDEKIMKSLKILLQHFYNGYRVPGLNFPVSYKEMLDWLEKQGKQKPQGKTALEAINEEKVEPKFKIKYAGNEYNVLEVKDIAGVTFYGIEDEPNHIDYIKAENCERVDGYSIKENGSTYPTKPAVFSEQNPAWSEEDESWFKEMELMCLYFSKDTDYRAEFSTWLKSLKDRVKTQQEWTMQDEEELKIALDTLEKAGQHSSAKWLKNVCLVPQNKWKPSGVQMTVLDDVIINGHLSNANQKILKGLQEQLKKL